MTVGSDIEDAIPTWKPQREDDAKFDSDFVFDVTGDPCVPEVVEDLVMTGTKPVQ